MITTYPLTAPDFRGTEKGIQIISALSKDQTNGTSDLPYYVAGLVVPDRTVPGCIPYVEMHLVPAEELPSNIMDMAFIEKVKELLVPESGTLTVKDTRYKFLDENNKTHSTKMICESHEGEVDDTDPRVNFLGTIMTYDVLAGNVLVLPEITGTGEIKAFTGIRVMTDIMTELVARVQEYKKWHTKKWQTEQKEKN